MLIPRIRIVCVVHGTPAISTAEPRLVILNEAGRHQEPGLYELHMKGLKCTVEGDYEHVFVFELVQDMGRCEHPKYPGGYCHWNSCPNVAPKCDHKPDYEGWCMWDCVRNVDTNMVQECNHVPKFPDGTCWVGSCWNFPK